MTSKKPTVPTALSEDSLQIDDRADHAYRFYLELGLFEQAQSLLSIGAGLGDIELLIAKNHKIQIGLIEPQAKYHDTFLENAQRASVKDRVLERHVGDFKSFHSTHKYDVVFSSHSWGNVGYSKDLVNKALSFLNPGGKLVITMNTQSDPVARSYRLLRPAKDDAMYVEEFANWCNDSGFEHSVTYWSRTSTSGFFLKDNELAKSFIEILEFWTQTPWNEIDTADRQQIQQIIISAAQDNQIELKYGTLCFTV